MRRSRVTALAITLLIALALSCGAISKEELACEQAVSRLSDCCPGLDTRRLPCVDSAGSGCSGKAEPTLSPRASSCILDSSCDALKAKGACDVVVEQSYVPHAIKDERVIEQGVCK